ncbi:MAG: hypothetical protein WCH37_11095, partial [Synechococcaceae cyanobacterium ELA182]
MPLAAMVLLLPGRAAAAQQAVEQGSPSFQAAPPSVAAALNNQAAQSLKEVPAAPTAAAEPADQRPKPPVALASGASPAQPAATPERSGSRITTVVSAAGSAASVTPARSDQASNLLAQAPSPGGDQAPAAPAADPLVPPGMGGAPQSPAPASPLNAEPSPSAQT